MVEKRDTQIAVDINPDDREAMTDEERQILLDRFREVADRIGERNKDLDPDEVLAEVTAVVEEVRQEHYEREQREAKERG
jgi:hypothetical protein